MKILITGCNGFLGSKLVEKLKNKHEVFGFDRNESKQNLAGFYQGNLNDVDALNKACSGKEIIIHLAALLDESAGKQKLFEVNAQGTENLIKASANAQQFIYLSSVGVHGQQKEKVNEASGFNPLTNYEASKLEAEKKVLASSLNYTILRSAMILGSNNYWKSIFKVIKKGFPLIGKGNNYFQLIFVDDLVNCIDFCVNNPKAFKQVFVVAEEQGMKLNDFYKLTCDLLKIKAKKPIPEFVGMLIASIMGLNKKSIVRVEHVKRLLKERNYDISKIKSIGWKPNFTTRQSIEKTLKEFQFI